ncbi:Tumor susceptibility protein, partial [Ophiophagus hannah]
MDRWRLAISGERDFVDNFVNRKYKYRDLAVQETVNVTGQYKDLKPVMDNYGESIMQVLEAKRRPQSDLIGLIQVMIVVFGDEPPVFSRPTISASYPPYQATGPPNSGYIDINKDGARNWYLTYHQASCFY